MPPELRLRFEADALIAQGKFSQAATKLEAQFAIDPQDEWNAIPLADVYFKLGRNYSALDMLRSINNPTRGDGDRSAFLLRCSLAAALNGDVYPGQRSYVRNWLMTDQSHGGAGMSDDTWFPKGTDANSMVALTSYAIVIKNVSHPSVMTLFYAKMAWGADRGNPMLASMLGTQLGDAGQVHEALAVVREGLHNLKRSAAPEGWLALRDQFSGLYSSLRSIGQLRPSEILKDDEQP